MALITCNSLDFAISTHLSMVYLFCILSQGSWYWIIEEFMILTLKNSNFFQLMYLPNYSAELQRSLFCEVNNIVWEIARIGQFAIVTYLMSHLFHYKHICLNKYQIIVRVRLCNIECCNVFQSLCIFSYIFDISVFIILL